MKEVCGNFICNAKKCPAAQQPCAHRNSCSMVSPAAEETNQSMEKQTCPAKNGLSLAQAYVPSQSYQPPMPQEQSLVCGTAFAELVMPYCSGWNLYRFAKEA